MKRVLLAYACIGAVYLLYLPDALPVLDDWMYLQIFHQARAGGLHAVLSLLHRMIDNTWLVQFRIFWASLMPVFALSFAADFSGWPYFLLAWTAHLLTAVLLWRVVAVLSNDSETGFIAGAVYAVFPATNNAIFWPVSNCIYYLQSLCLLGWFYLTWKKLREGDCRYSWLDLGLLVPVVFSGEQILPSLALLLPVTFWLFGERHDRRHFARYWSIHLAAMAILAGVYALLVNGMPILQGFRNRYENAQHWSLRPAQYLLFSSLGLNRDFFRWPDRWWAQWTLLLLVALAVSAFFWGFRVSASPRPRVSASPRLLLWSLAGAILTYLPSARLSTFEWRYLYVPSMFLVAAGSAVLALLPSRPLRSALAVLTISYCLMQTYFGMRQCWMPQSREARALMDAVASSKPFGQHDVLIFSGDHIATGPAPSFITGASWSMQSMLEHATGLDHIQGARDLVINESGELALHRRDSFRWFHRAEIGRLRVFVRNRGNRFVAKSILALPASGGRFQLFALRPLADRSLPAEALTMDELKRQPWFEEIYFARRIHNHARPTDL